jgi:hypothetical protein
MAVSRVFHGVKFEAASRIKYDPERSRGRLLTKDDVDPVIALDVKV